MTIENPENTLFATHGFPNLIREGGRTVGSGRVATIFEYANRGERSPAFDYKAVLSTTVITINTSHKFYTSFLSKLCDSPDAKTTFELFLASFFQSIRKTNAYQSEQNDKLMTIWYNELNNYITEQLSPRKWEEELFMPFTEAYREHIMYTFNGYYGNVYPRPHYRGEFQKSQSEGENRTP